MDNCEYCGRTFSEEVHHSIIEPALCSDCACDPVLPQNIEWWRTIEIEKALWEAGLTRGIWATGLRDAYATASDSRWRTPYDDYYDNHCDYLREEWNSPDGFKEFVNFRDEFDEADVEEALATSVPFEALGRMGYYDPDLLIYQYAEDDMDHIFSEIDNLDDIDLANAIGVVSSSDVGVWAELCARACEIGDYKKGDAYWRMGIALQIYPTEFAFDTYGYGSVEHTYDATIGICESCLHPFNRGDLELEKGGSAVLCKHCAEAPLCLRRGRLCWLHITGRLPVSLDKLLDEELEWLLWPQELQEKLRWGDIVPERLVK